MLVELNLAVSRAFVSESYREMQALMEVTDAQHLIALQAGMFKLLADKAAGYARQVQSVLADSGVELSKTMQARTAQAKMAFVGALENLTCKTPAATAPAVVALKNALILRHGCLDSDSAQAWPTSDATQVIGTVKNASKEV